MPPWDVCRGWPSGRSFSQSSSSSSPLTWCSNRWSRGSDRRYPMLKLCRSYRLHQATLSHQDTPRQPLQELTGSLACYPRRDTDCGFSRFLLRGRASTSVFTIRSMCCAAGLSDSPVPCSAPVGPYGIVANLQSGFPRGRGSSVGRAHD